MNLTHAKILVTGANRGLGQALVKQLLGTDCAQLYAAARRPETIAQHDARVEAVALDVTQASSVERLAAELPPLDLVINNAGVVEFGSILEVDEGAIDHCFDVNVKGLWRVACAFAPHLIQGSGGALCNILSVLSLASMPGIAAYNLSKAAAWSAAMSLRASLGSQAVSVHNVFPGPIDTDMIAALEMDKAAPDAVAAEIVAAIEQDREDLFPATAHAVYQAWQRDHKEVERQFAAA